MTAVHIIDTGLSVAPALGRLLGLRRVAVTRGDMPAGQTAETVIARAAPGAERMAMDTARALKAKRVVLVDEDAAAPLLVEEAGGRLLRVGLPRPAAALPALSDAGLLWLADILGAQARAMVAADPATGALIDLARRVARSDVTVFINGPTGSGKEVLARQIHAASRRAAAPFIAVNCAAIPENMLEAILFGHEKGAFTGAGVANKGIFRAADGGTLLLDEVSEMPAGLQTKLLRVLQERAVTPIGAHEEVPVDVRIIATSNRDMARAVREGAFREDLFYRLNVFPLATRPLATRPDDIPALAVALVRRHLSPGMAMPAIPAETLAALSAHRWPGNVRELENVIQRALVLAEDGVIRPADILTDADAGAAPAADLAVAV